MDTDEYRRRGKEMVDYIADYLDTVRYRRVYPDVKPGYMKELIPHTAPVEGQEWSEIFDDIERVIMPGITHWQSPHMHAYFPALNCYPALLGDMVSDAINCLGFTWASSPACTELETLVMDWLGKMIGLSQKFLHYGTEGKGGGVLQGTCSEATLVSFLAARTSAIDRLREQNAELRDKSDWDICSKLVAYCSDQAHSSVEKARMICMVKIRFLPSDDKLSLRGEVVRQALTQDKAAGLIPFFLCATLGTTGACAFDNLQEIGPICEKENIWIHVDAAYAGTALVCPEFRYLLKGVEHARTFAFNPSKWMMVTFDCTAMWVDDSSTLHRTFNVDPLYLQHENSGASIDYMHWQIPLSRRFRSLKLWFVIRSYGVKGLQKHVREGVRLAKKFESLVRNDPLFEVGADRIMGLVCFRIKGPNKLTEKLLKKLNSHGKVHMVPAALKGRYVIRFTVTSPQTTDDDIVSDWEVIRETALEVLRTSSNLFENISSNGTLKELTEVDEEIVDVDEAERYIKELMIENERSQEETPETETNKSSEPSADEEDEDEDAEPVCNGTVPENIEETGEETRRGKGVSDLTGFLRSTLRIPILGQVGRMNTEPLAGQSPPRRYVKEVRRRIKKQLSEDTGYQVNPFLTSASRSMSHDSAIDTISTDALCHLPSLYGPSSPLVKKSFKFEKKEGAD